MTSRRPLRGHQPRGRGDLAVAGEPILDLLNGFIVELREAGLPVSLTENLDAMAAIRHIPLEDREAFKYALGRHPGEEQRPLAVVRDRVRGLLLAAGRQVRHRRRRPRAGPRRPARRRRARRRGRPGERPVRPGRRRRPHARGAPAAALPGDDEGRRGPDAGHRPPGRQALRRHGARSPRRRHLLPLPHAAEPRPRRPAREDDGAAPRARPTRTASELVRSRSVSSRTSTSTASRP